MAKANELTKAELIEQIVGYPDDYVIRIYLGEEDDEPMEAGTFDIPQIDVDDDDGVIYLCPFQEEGQEPEKDDNVIEGEFTVIKPKPVRRKSA